jgi:DEAD/DEAH box helicase domain-containing protein
MQQTREIKNLLKKINRDFNEEIAHYRYIETLPSQFSEPESPIEENLRDVLNSKGINRLFTHQSKGIDQIRKGHNVVVMTPAASGKSLIYNIPVLEAILKDQSTKALYLFPLKGLEQDQIKTLREFASALDIKHSAEIYDGDTTAYRRKKIRESFPNIIFSNPDMLHLALNAFHSKWAEFFKNLKVVVIDEIHTYRGVFGSHVSQVFRRLRRICGYYGSNPQFVACSATIANPGELAEHLTGVRFSVIDNNGAPSGGKHIFFINPLGSTYTAATKALRVCLDAGLKTIAFTKARKVTELIYSWLVEASEKYRDIASSYRAGFLPSERREIEQKLFSGKLQGVVSTSALELGVDIGGLDACILAGYPGSIASTWQRAGRVGRQGQDSIIIMVGLKDALDQYFMRHPDDFFGRSHEAVVIDSFNTSILKQHLPCATSEIYLKVDDPVYQIKTGETSGSPDGTDSKDGITSALNELVKEKLMKPGKNGDIWFTPLRFPHRDVNIRGIGKIFTAFCDGMRIAEISETRVFKEAHPGAIYLHRGKQYRVEDLDLEELKVICKEVDASYYTQATSHEETEIINEQAKRKNTSWGNLKITNTVTGYWKKRLTTQEKISRFSLELPSWTFETQGLWITLVSDLETKIINKSLDFAGGLHALEHAAISALPLFAMCDKGDIGGISYPLYPDFGLPAIFIYDGFQGGVGLTKRGFDVMEMWLDATGKIITECDCEFGCPSCIQDSQCGSGNEPLDKNAALVILEEIKKAVM